MPIIFIFALNFNINYMDELIVDCFQYDCDWLCECCPCFRTAYDNYFFGVY